MDEMTTRRPGHGKSPAELLYCYFHPKLVAGFLAATGDPELAQELTIETFILVLARLDPHAPNVETFVGIIALEVMLARLG